MRSLVVVAKKYTENVYEIYQAYREYPGEYLKSFEMETKTVWKPHFFKYCQVRSIYFLVSKVLNKTLIENLLLSA